MSAVSDAAQAIAAAIKMVPKVRVYLDPTASVDPPGVVIGPPRLYWERMGSAPTKAQFDVLVVTPSSDTAMTKLWELVPAVAAAISDHSDGAVDDNGAVPLPFTAGSASLPSYTLSITIPLGD